MMATQWLNHVLWDIYPSSLNLMLVKWVNQPTANILWN
jgi:hypothetical protein